MFASGMRSLYSVLDSDGALSAADKALFTACAACTQYLPDLTLTYLARARDLGITADEASGASLVIMLNRGETAFRDFDSAVHQIYERGGSPEVPQSTITATTDEALAYFEHHFGAVPPRQILFSELSPISFQGYYQLHRSALKENTLAHKKVELLLCTVIAASYHFGILEIHARSAMGVGASHAEVTEAVLAAIPVSGMTVWATGAVALANTRPEVVEPAVS
jgi:alkylhydroperoxidase/carboxymuconolactone decarboxylase family protein YurZ